MGNRDLEVLLAIESGDTVKYQRLWDKLTLHANSLALNWFSSPALRNDAVEKAMDKVGDWLTPDGIRYVDHPWALAKETIYNSLIDSTRTRRLEEVEITAVRSIKERDILCGVDEGIEKMFETPDDEKDDAQGSGWREFQIVSEGRKRKTDDDEYHTHRWIEGLDELLKYEWWWDIGKWEKKVESNRKRAMQRLRGAWEEAELHYNECTAKLWSNYNLIMARIDSIPGDSARRVMRAYLAELKQVEIARHFVVSKPYVSNIVNKYLKEWEWDEPDIYKAKLIFLTHHLAILARDYVRDIEKAVNLDRELGWPVSFKGYSDALECYKERIYSRAVNSLETKIYFGDLEEEHTGSLVSTCACFYDRWYPTKARRSSIFRLTFQNPFRLI